MFRRVVSSSVHLNRLSSKRFCFYATTGSLNTPINLPGITNASTSAKRQILQWTRCRLCQLYRKRLLNTSMTNLKAFNKAFNKERLKPIPKLSQKMQKASRAVVFVQHNMTVEELAKAMDKDIDHVFEVMLYIPGAQTYDSPQSVIDRMGIVKQIVEKSGMRIQLAETKVEVERENKDEVKSPTPDKSQLVKRPPVVTIMGHVDHGKTTLLDALRKSNVVATEFGGITQHIGAFSVTLADSGEKITFIDTPGHAAFEAMRSRGAHVTDIVVLVVAADDGVMKQTVESIRHAREANVPIIVAINKIDKPGCDLNHAKQSLATAGVVIEEYGGDVQAIPISALKATNLDRLLESIVALAEILEVGGDPNGRVEGVVLESKIDPGRGKLSTALIQRGTLKKGKALVAGTAWAKVRGLFDDANQPLSAASPGTPVEIIGWRDLPSAGDEILEVESEQRAREVTSWRLEEDKDKIMIQNKVVIEQKMEEHRREYKELRKRGVRGAIYRRRRTKESGAAATPGDEKPELCVVVKGDVDGSVEAILDVLETYESPQCDLHVLQFGVGAVTEVDVEMASNFAGVIYAFNTHCPRGVAEMARAKNVDVLRHNVIYKLFDDVRERLTSKLPSVRVEETLGEADVLQLFTVTEKKRQVAVAGCRCTKGMLVKKKSFKLLRNGEIVFVGELASLKHLKTEVESIKLGVDCGLSFSDKGVNPQIGDVIICYEMKDVKQALKWDLQF